jgi:hypothetical protein
VTASAAFDQDDLGWRDGGVCNASDADLHFAEIEELVEEGYTKAEAKEFVAEAEEMAKGMCAACPIRGKCLSSAMVNDEKWGVWGGMTRAERLAYLPAFKTIKALQGVDTKPTVQQDYDALSNNTGVNGRYHLRVLRAQECVNRLRLLPADWTLTNRKYGTHGRDEFVSLFELIVRYPERRSEALAMGLEKSATWFNDMCRNARFAVGVD